MPTCLGWGARLEGGGGTAKHVGGGGVVAVVGGFEVTGEGGVLGVLEVPVGPAVGRTGAVVDSWNTFGGGGRVGRRRSDGTWAALLGCVGAVVACALSSRGEAAVLVGCSKMEDKGGERFVGLGLGAPVATGNFEKPCVLD